MYGTIFRGAQCLVPWAVSYTDKGGVSYYEKI